MVVIGPKYFGHLDVGTIEATTGCSPGEKGLCLAAFNRMGSVDERVSSPAMLCCVGGQPYLILKIMGGVTSCYYAKEKSGELAAIRYIANITLNNVQPLFTK